MLLRFTAVNIPCPILLLQNFFVRRTWIKCEYRQKGEEEEEEKEKRRGAGGEEKEKEKEKAKKKKKEGGVDKG